MLMIDKLLVAVRDGWVQGNEMKARAWGQS
jgi:hypothetical protein